MSARAMLAGPDMTVRIGCYCFELSAICASIFETREQLTRRAGALTPAKTKHASALAGCRSRSSLPPPSHVLELGRLGLDAELLRPLLIMSRHRISNLATGACRNLVDLVVSRAACEFARDARNDIHIHALCGTSAGGSWSRRRADEAMISTGYVKVPVAQRPRLNSREACQGAGSLTLPRKSSTFGLPGQIMWGRQVSAARRLAASRSEHS